FARAGAWAEAHKARVYVSEFAVYRVADAESTERYIRALRRASERHGFSWAVWDYNGEFAVRRDGQPTAVWKGLFTEASASERAWRRAPRREAARGELESKSGFLWHYRERIAVGQIGKEPIRGQPVGHGIAMEEQIHQADQFIVALI